MPSHKSELHIKANELKQGYQVLRGLNHQLRIKLLRHIHRCGKATVIEIYKPLKLEQPFASLHLGILRQSSLVNANREGRQIFYSVNYQKINEIQRLINDLLNTEPGPGARACSPTPSE